jgi:enoyl-CoA hydratase
LPPDEAVEGRRGLIKRACQSGAEMSLENGLALERELQQQLFQSEDAKEGIRAYNAKRKPEFRGA